MKFKCGKTTEEWDAIKQWHPWFAWYPVSVKDGDCRWLERVQRKADTIDEFGILWRYQSL